MIVRISGDDQYRLDDATRGRLNELDAAVIAAVDAGEEAAFGAALQELLAYVRENGSRVGEQEIETSDLILPPEDITLEEAAAEFTGEGLIPD
jgi:hypothetical protein